MATVLKWFRSYLAKYWFTLHSEFSFHVWDFSSAEVWLHISANCFRVFSCVWCFKFICRPPLKNYGEGMQGSQLDMLLFCSCLLVIHLHLASKKLEGFSFQNLWFPSLQYSWNLSYKCKKHLTEEKECWQTGRALLLLWLVWMC